MERLLENCTPPLTDAGRAYESRINRKMATGVIVTVLSAAAYIAPFFITFPLAAPIQIIALGVLTATSYGVITAQYHCRIYLPLFTIHHITLPYLKELLQNSPTRNGLAWGIYETWETGLIAGVVALACRATKFVALSAVGMTPIAIAIVGHACYEMYQATKKNKS